MDCLHFILSIGNRLGWNDTDTIDGVVVQHLISEKGLIQQKHSLACYPLLMDSISAMWKSGHISAYLQRSLN